MKRSPMKPSKPLARTPFKRKSPVASTGMLSVQSHQRTAPAKKAKLKSMRPKMTPIRKSAKGEACTLRFPCCCGDLDTVVWCHSNHSADGKGAGLKARDEEGAYGCHTCHAWLDGGYASHMPRSLVDKYFDLARTESQAILRRKGLMP